MVIVERAAQLHESNVVRYNMPRVNNTACEAAVRIGIGCYQTRGGIEDLLPDHYGEQISWDENDGSCVEILGRGFTVDDWTALFELPRGQTVCSWVL